MVKLEVMLKILIFDFFGWGALPPSSHEMVT